MEEEVEIQCPYCAEQIFILVDTSVPHQNYIEDCSVCCQPIEIETHCSEETGITVQATKS